MANDEILKEQKTFYSDNMKFERLPIDPVLKELLEINKIIARMNEKILLAYGLSPKYFTKDGE